MPADWIICACTRGFNTTMPIAACLRAGTRELRRGGGSRGSMRSMRSMGRMRRMRSMRSMRGVRIRRIG